MATFNRRGYKKSKSDQAQKGEKSQTAEVFESLDSTANKSEQWILKNQNIILTFIAVISISVLSYLGYERLIADPNEKEAISELNKAQYFFELALVSNESDSLFKLALNGGEGKYGFLDIVKEYSGTRLKVCHFMCTETKNSSISEAMCLTAFCINSFVSDLTFDAFLSFTFLIAFRLLFFHHGAKDVLLALDAGNLNNIKCDLSLPDILICISFICCRSDI